MEGSCVIRLPPQITRLFHLLKFDSRLGCHRSYASLLSRCLVLHIPSASLRRNLLRRFRHSFSLEVHWQEKLPIRRLQVEPDRWLVMASDDRPCGFCYSMVDKQDRQGWGFIAEFYVQPANRRRGIGSQLCEKTEALLATSGVHQLWLTSNEVAKPFWQAMGLQSTGEVESNGHEIMAKVLQPPGRRHKT